MEPREWSWDRNQNRWLKWMERGGALYATGRPDIWRLTVYHKGKVMFDETRECNVTRAKAILDAVWATR